MSLRFAMMGAFFATTLSPAAFADEHVLEYLGRLPEPGVERDFVTACFNAGRRMSALPDIENVMIYRPRFRPLGAERMPRYGLDPAEAVPNMQYAFVYLMFLRGDSWQTMDGEYVECEAPFDPASPRFPQVFMTISRDSEGDVLPGRN